MTTECASCGNEFKQLGQHWSKSECDYPNLTKHQKEVVIGLLMGDGCINRGGGGNLNPYIQSKMTNKKYLKYIDKKFGVLATGVSLYNTAEESAKQDRKNEFNEVAETKNYSDIYIWQSRRHPQLQEFAEWYSSGEKIWPEDIELTPTVLKHWYCGDGHWSNSHKRIQIGAANELKNQPKINKMFERKGFEVSNWNEHNICFTQRESRKLLEYMGDPLPGFEYKWGGTYER